MTPMQKLWLAIFNFGPAIFLGIYKKWWVGIATLLATFVISWVLTFVITMNIPSSAMKTWAWVKPPIIAAAVLGAGLWLF